VHNILLCFDTLLKFFYNIWNTILKKRKKKKKKVFKVPEEVINDRSKDCNMDIIHSPSP
ncbi:hypothetical protein NDU88_001873, partial [Pleurodeles waltl]